ncbi:hypothetical protein [Sphingobacterium sp.]|uniref:hypothetical protein n=1 Tax=Sphingobacterium sp. TaxID=341027 RepID=UPI002898B5CE|nr:hypothetical protein [Sphingobacterium sp.]
MAKTPLLEKRAENILKDFTRLFNQGLRTEVIYQKLSEKYFLAENTVTKIVRSQARKTVKNNNNHVKK